MAADPYTVVKQELLVRYLGFWAPTALHSARRATYLDRSRYGPAAAVRVFAEFADLLAGRELVTLVDGAPPADPGVEGLRLAPLPADLLGAVGRGPVLALVDGAPLPDELAAALGHAARGGELLLVTGPEAGGAGPGGGAGSRVALHAAGFAHVLAVELVDRAGSAQLLRFATSAVRSLERFKDELWAVDEFAGIRYRDPGLPDAEPLDISYEPHLGPLRRTLVDHLAAGGARTVTELRGYALIRTLYRPADVPRALASLLAKGELVREPDRGRLTGSTVVRLPD